MDDPTPTPSQPARASRNASNTSYFGYVNPEGGVVPFVTDVKFSV